VTTPDDLARAFDPQRLRFVPIAAHRRVLTQGVLRVEGLRGSGKTTLVHTLLQRSGEPIYPWFGALPVPFPRVHFVSMHEPVPADDRRARHVMAIARLLHDSAEVNTAGLPPPGDSGPQALAWLSTLDGTLKERQAGVVVLYDEPDAGTGDILGLWLSLRRRLPHITARVFLRPETPVDLPAQEADDLRRATATLTWEPADLSRLIAARLHDLAPVDDILPVAPSPWGPLPERPAEDPMVDLAARLAGRAIGTGVRRVYTSRWLMGVSQGRRGETTPAVLLDLLSSAAGFRRDHPPETPLERPPDAPLDLAALEFGLASAARRAATALSDDLQLGDALWAMRETGTPISRAAAVDLWGEALTERLLRERVLIAAANLVDLAPLIREGLGVRPSALAPTPPPPEPSTPRPRRAPETKSEQVRQQLVDALQLDLVGPEDESVERLSSRPSSWYLTGFLVPYEAPPADATASEQVDMATTGSGGDDDAAPERASPRRVPFPSSMGMSVLVPAHTEVLDATVTWGDYRKAAAVDGEIWERTPRRGSLGLIVRPDKRGRINWEEVPSSDGLHIEWHVREVRQGASSGNLAVSVFLVNHRPMPKAAQPDEELPPPDSAYAFQARLELHCRAGLIARNDPRGSQRDDWDEDVARLQYHDAQEIAVGHGVSTHSPSLHTVHTTWLPQADVERVEPGPVDGVELSMERLARLADDEAIDAALSALPRLYRAWLSKQKAPHPDHTATTDDLLERATRACQRIEDGIGLLHEHPLALRAFRWTQEVMAESARQRVAVQRGVEPEKVEPPQWRPFQLAFLLLNLRGIVDPDHADRDTVDLLFFPTGGGKTEAYLGLAAFTLLWRRLSHPGVDGCGMTVLMRYTLRLLTFDQLGRAAALICALELLRSRTGDHLGTWPFEIGLWVGRAATPNRMGQRGDSDPHTARVKVERYQQGKGPSPIPLEICPWCGTRFRANSFDLRPNASNPTDLRLLCANRRCPFSGRRPLPIVTVDEPIYRRLPCFLIATVDKLAQLPWVGESGKLFGHADRYDSEGFYGPCEPELGRPLPGGRLLPPDLIIQDELHLISGPLGTMVGLYETAVDALCTQSGRRPKVIASTATVRRAEQQVRALFARDQVDLFPPQGPDRRDSFFARSVLIQDVPGRHYIGVAAQGRSMRVIFLRTMLALMGAAQAAWHKAGGTRVDPNPADPYMTVVAYFNSLRELGGSRRIVEDEVRSRLVGYQARLRVGEASGPFRKREIGEPVELTSRESTDRVADTKRRLELPFFDNERVDVALATNMISVGLDISRLGLMVVSGQPKMSAEYIQATSRVGRDSKRPGLVVTLLNLFRPRDRSHYETFTTWHNSFYRAVEATSVTPFSPRAVDRGIAGVTVTLARHRTPELTPSTQATRMRQLRGPATEVEDLVEKRAQQVTNAPPTAAGVRRRVSRVLDAWRHIAEVNHDVGVGLRYQSGESGSQPALLRDPLSADLLSSEQRLFRVHRSMRDVEPSVNLWVRTLDGHDLPSEET
jgi:hypothetical protein